MKFVSRLIIFALPGCLIIAFAAAVLSYRTMDKTRQDAAAKPEFKCENALSVATTDSVPDTYPLHIWRKGIWFEVPVGFRNPWLSPVRCLHTRESAEDILKQSEGRGYDPETGGYNPRLHTDNNVIFHDLGRLSFCMPEVSFFNRYYYTQKRGRVQGIGPCGNKTGEASGDSYPVVFSIIEAYTDNIESSPFLNGLLSSKKSFEENGYYESQNSVHADHNQNGPISGDRNYSIISDDGDLVVTFSCSTVHNCDGTVWARSRKLLFTIELPFDRVQIGEEERWREPVGKVIDLIEEWRE